MERVEPYPGYNKEARPYFWQWPILWMFALIWGGYRKRKIIAQYIVVGGVGSVILTVEMWQASRWVAYWVAFPFCAFIAASIVYLIDGSLVFHSVTFGKWIKFLSADVVTFLIQYAALFVAVSLLHVNVVIGTIISIAAQLPVSIILALKIWHK